MATNALLGATPSGINQIDGIALTSISLSGTVASNPIPGLTLTDGMKLWLTANTGVEGIYNCSVTTGNYTLTLDVSLNSASTYNNKQPTQFYVSQGTNAGAYMRSVAIDGTTIQISQINTPIVNTIAQLNALTLANGSYATLSTYDINAGTFYPAGSYVKSSGFWGLVNNQSNVSLAISAFSQVPVTTTGAPVIRGWTVKPNKLVWLNAPSQAGGAGLWQTSATAWTFLCGVSGFNYDQSLVIIDSLDVGIRYQISLISGNKDLTKINNSFIACKFASTPGTDITLSGIPDKEYTDQVQAEDGDIALVWQQSSFPVSRLYQNGVYIVNAVGAWTRHPQFDTWAKLQYLTAVIQYGQQASGYTFYTNIPTTGTLDTSAIIIYKSTQNASIYNQTDFQMSKGGIPNNGITSVACYGYPDPIVDPIPLPDGPTTDDYSVIFHGAGLATTNPLYIVNRNGNGNIDLGNYGGITNAGFVIKNNGFYARFIYQDYGVKPVFFFGDISTANAFIETIDPPLSAGNLPFVIGQKLQYSAITNFFPVNTTITNIDVGLNRLTVSNNANETSTSRALTAIIYDYEADPAYVLTEYSYETNEIQGVTYVSANGSDTFGEPNNFGQSYATPQAGFLNTASGNQLQIYPKGLLGYSTGITVTSQHVGTEILAIGDNVTINDDINIGTATTEDIDVFSVTGPYINNLNLVCQAGNLGKIYYRQGAINNLNLDCGSSADPTNTGFNNTIQLDGTYFVGGINSLPTNWAKQTTPQTVILNGCSWEAGGASQVINLNGDKLTYILTNCTDIPNQVNFANGATSANWIVNKVPAYNLTKGFNATAITAGALTINNGTNNVSGGLTTNATSITLLKNNTYLINAEVTINLSGGGAVTLALAVATGDTTSTIYTQSYSTTANGQHQVSLQAIFQTSRTVNGAVAIVASGITNTVDILASSSIMVTTYNAFLN